MEVQFEAKSTLTRQLRHERLLITDNNFLVVFAEPLINGTAIIERIWYILAIKALLYALLVCHILNFLTFFISSFFKS